DRVFVRDVHHRPVRKDFFHGQEENVPFIGAVEIVAHEKAAAQEVLAELDNLCVGQLPVAHLDGIEPRIIEHVVVIVQVNRLFDTPGVNPSEAAYGGGKVGH